MTKQARRRAAPYKHVDRIEVHLWDQLMGMAALDPAYGYYVFAYTPAFRASGIEPSPLRMPAAGQDTYIFTDLPEVTYKRLPAMLSDALPDDFGNVLIDRYMADNGIDSEAVTPLDRLAYMNNRAMGALTFKPTRGPRSRTPTAIDLSELVQTARQAVHGSLDTDHQAYEALRHIIDVGTSAGGAKAKAVIAWNPTTREIKSGQLDAPDGFEHWLLKFDGMESDSSLGKSKESGRVEYAYSLMAKQAGITMMPCELLEENGRAHFMTKRFDRGERGVRHHVQTLCALDHLDYKKKNAIGYSQVFAAMDRLSLPYEDKEQAFRRMVFNVMARNCDDHTKNISFRLRQGQAWELAPAYDLTFSYKPGHTWIDRHFLSINGRFADIRVDDIRAEADRAGVGSWPRIVVEVREAVTAWPEFAKQAGVQAARIKTIREHMRIL